MALPPSRKDTFGPPKPGRNVTDLSALARHQRTYARNLDTGMLDGRFVTPKPVAPGVVSDLVGGDAASGDAGTDETLFCNTDQYLITGPGDVTFTLSHIPLDGSLHVYWPPLEVPIENWTLSDDVLTVIDSGWEAEDLIEVAYAYAYDGEDEPSDTISDYGSQANVNWRWFQTSTHNGSIVYADPAYDDSGWAIAPAPFGETTPPHDGGGDIGDYNTVWQQHTRMWARIDIVAEPGIDVILKSKWNRILRVYWNGSLYVTQTQVGHEYLQVATIPGDQVLATNLLAAQVTDDGFSGTHTGCYFDLGAFQVNGEAPL